MRDRQCALNRDVAESVLIVSGVINKPTTVDLCISPVYRRLAVEKVKLLKIDSPSSMGNRVNRIISVDIKRSII